MKKLMLAVCITVVFSLPCMAQGVEANRLMGLHGTLWGEMGNTTSDHYLGFYDGKVYLEVTDYGCGTGPSNTYVDLLFTSLFRFTFDEVDYLNGFLCPLLGIGVATGVGPDPATGEMIRLTLVMKKVSDDWYPEDCIDLTEVTD